MTIGGMNPIPFEVGGGPTEDEIVYTALRNAVGEGGSAKSEDGIDGLWRRCRARAIASVSKMMQRSALQAFAHVATDHIAVYEDILGIVPPGDATDEQRRQVIASEWVSQIAADMPDLKSSLQAIDARTDILDIPQAVSKTTLMGKAFQPQDASPPYGGGRMSTAWPAYSDNDVVVALLTLGGDVLVPTPEDDLKILAIKRFLKKALPTYVDFRVATSSGFVADLSPLDLTAME